jgi:type I restriction enzyme S subunit
MKVVNAGDILEVKTGKYDANHAKENGSYHFFTCALEPLRTDTFSFNDEVIILPGNGANVGEVLYYCGKLEAYQRTYVLHNIKACPKYLYYYFKKYWIRQITKRQVGSATNYIKMDDVVSFQIPLPPLEQQKKIASILDAADTYRQKTKALIAKYDELTQSSFLDMFGDPVKNEKGWEKVELGEISNKITDGEHQNPSATLGGKHLIMAKDVLDDRVDFSNPRFVSNEDFIKYTSKCKPELGDILIVSRGATVGRCTIVNTETPFCLMGSVILIKKGTEFKSEFMNILLKNNKFSKQLTNVSSASAQQAIYISHLKKLQVILPPLSLQTKFAECIQAMEIQKAQAQASLVKAEELFNSLLHKAFKGELV